MEEIYKILMRRDGITENEARNLVEECREAINDIFANAESNNFFALYDEVTDTIADYLSLEPDYLEYLL